MTSPARGEERLDAQLFDWRNRQELVDFIRTVRLHPDYYLQKLDWQFVNAPYTSREAPAPMTVCRRLGRIVGMMGSMPVRMWRDGNPVRAAWAINLLVGPESRGQGVATTLARLFADTHPVALALPMAQGSRSVFQRAGYDVNRRLPLLVRPLSVRTGLQHFLPSSWLSRLLSAPVDALLEGSLAFRLRGDRSRNSARVDFLSPRVSVFFQKLTTRFDVIIDRSYQYLHWKYREQPAIDHVFLEFDGNGTTSYRGYAILRVIDTRSGVRVGTFVDLLTDPDDAVATDSLILAGLETFRSANVDLVRAWFSHASFERRFRRLGFIPCNLPKLQLNPYYLASHEQGGTGALAPEIRKWFLTIGDSDEDRGQLEGEPA